MMDAIWKILQHVKDNGPTDPSYGICSSVDDHGDELDWSDDMDRLWSENRTKCFRDWGEFSGSDIYPVPGYGALSVGDAYNSADDDTMWSPDHKYGAARLRLLDHCIEWFKELES